MSFLNQHVWSPKLKIGELDIAYLHSRHAEDNFGCTQVDVIDAHAAKAIANIDTREKLTLIKRRLFNDRGLEIPVYVTVRKKDSAAKVLKLLRKNEKNPAVAVDDELGLMAVLDSIRQVDKRSAIHQRVGLRSIPGRIFSVPKADNQAWFCHQAGKSANESRTASG